jgi:hypothetical protein
VSLRAAVAVLVATYAFDARAEVPTKEDCIVANEHASSARKSGHLREARGGFRTCAVPACPQAVRDDCAAAVDSIDKAIPTIVFAAKDARGNDLTDVEVKMDGAVLRQRLGGTAIEIDPGEHTFVFTMPGREPITKPLVIAEGVKSRTEVVTFPAVAGEEPQPLIYPPVPPPPDGSVQRTLAITLAGAGVVAVGVGAFFGLRSKSTYDDARAHCPNGNGSCDDTGVSGGNDAHTQATISTISFILGGAALAASAVLYFTAPRSARARLDIPRGVATW